MGVLVHEGFGLGEGGERPAVVEVALLHGGLEVVVDEVGGRGDAQVPVEGLQQQQLHLDEVALVEHQVEAAHDAQGVELLQLGHTVLLLLKLAWGTHGGWGSGDGHWNAWQNRLSLSNIQGSMHSAFRDWEVNSNTCILLYESASKIMVTKEQLMMVVHLARYTFDTLNPQGDKRAAEYLKHCSNSSH